MNRPKNTKPFKPTDFVLTLGETAQTTEEVETYMDGLVGKEFGKG